MNKANPEMVCYQLIQELYWYDMLEALAHSINLAHQYGPDKWGIRLAKNSIMLKVGPHEVLQIGHWNLPLHIIVYKTTVPNYLRQRKDIQFSKDLDCYGNKSVKGYYSSNPGSEACDFKFEYLRDVYDALFDSHREIVARGAQKRRHSSTKADHSVELVQFISDQLGESLPQPEYCEKSGYRPSIKAPDAGISDNLQRLIDLQREAGIKDIGNDTINTIDIHKLREIAISKASKSSTTKERRAFYRLRSVAIKLYALQRAKGNCEGCNSPAPFRKQDGSPYLEPHHTLRLADGGPDDPRSVIALCPNCHKKAHYSIDAETFNDKLIESLSVIEGE